MNQCCALYLILSGAWAQLCWWLGLTWALRFLGYFSVESTTAMLMWCKYCVLPVKGKVMWTNCVLANFPA